MFKASTLQARTLKSPNSDMVKGLGLRAQGLGLKVKGLGLGFRAYGLSLGV